MSHPYNDKREDKVAKSRVSSITNGAASGGSPKCYAAGGAVSSNAGEGVPSMRADGGSVKGRSDRPSRAKGGRVKKAGHTVNVIVAPSGGPQAGLGPPKLPMPPPPAAAPAMPPMAAKPAMPPMLPPGAGAPAGPPMMRAKGGKVSAADVKGKTGIGDRTKIQHSGNKNDGQNIGRKDVVTKAKGGPINADGAAGKQMGPKLSGGARGGAARRDKEQLAINGKY